MLIPTIPEIPLLFPRFYDLNISKPFYTVKPVCFIDKHSGIIYKKNIKCNNIRIDFKHKKKILL
ncbi:MAG: hypothetical protein A2042_08835 [Candidatus Schekmanbacteria bacterium GWA2_38_11]|uniref:Uncharacterized protein n=1 Tax=Candidatus Schekmanbacteria bacterium GWA2_38_11 TaxID=1817876 RepID=A0A1F7RA28_9BACT|nr:MAG: hypothetical protein A2042_08835 [Candidatus Schekmanbacteria bacterium GWA2_38_11]